MWLGVKRCHDLVCELLGVSGLMVGCGELCCGVWKQSWWKTVCFSKVQLCSQGALQYGGGVWVHDAVLLHVWFVLDCAHLGVNVETQKSHVRLVLEDDRVTVESRVQKLLKSR